MAKRQSGDRPAEPRPQHGALPDAVRLEADLRRLQRVKAAPGAVPDRLGPELVNFFKQSVQKRQTKLVKIAEVFAQVVPAPLLEHCCIESFARGRLTVLCDSSAHLFDLKSLLLEGLQQQLLSRCKAAGLTQVAVKLGRWYEGEAAERRPSFGK